MMLLNRRPCSYSLVKGSTAATAAIAEAEAGFLRMGAAAATFLSFFLSLIAFGPAVDDGRLRKAASAALTLHSSQSSTLP